MRLVGWQAIDADRAEGHEAGAVGALIVMPLSFDALKGVYTFGVPALHDMPSLYIDRDTGASLVEAANAGKTARLRLISQTEQAEAYQLFDSRGSGVLKVLLDPNL